MLIENTLFGARTGNERTVLTMNELIKALRTCADHNAVGDKCYGECPYNGNYNECVDQMILDAADALEEQQKQIKELERNFIDVCNANGSLACERNELLNDVRELEAQLPKEGEWIPINWIEDAHMFKCSVCDEISCCNARVCNNCGARMTKGEQE